MKLTLLLLSLFVSFEAFSQNLMEERIWKIGNRKKSIFLDSGVFHYNSILAGASVTGVRNSVVPGRGYERVVIDFNTQTIPKVYGNISGKDKKISVDLFEASVSTEQPNLKNSKFVKSIDFISVDGKTVTLEINLKSKASFDVFFLENPGRLVIDIR